MLVAGRPEEGVLLQGDYTYVDLDGDPEAGSVLRWYRANGPDGSGARVIAEGSRTYMPGIADAGCWLRFEAVPRNDAAEKNSGGAAACRWFGPVLAKGESLADGGDFEGEHDLDGWLGEPGLHIAADGPANHVLAMQAGDDGNYMLRTPEFDCAGRDALQCGMRLVDADAALGAVRFDIAVEFFAADGSSLGSAAASPDGGCVAEPGSLPPFVTSRVTGSVPSAAVRARYIFTASGLSCSGGLALDDFGVRAISASVPRANNVRVIYQPAAGCTVQAGYTYEDRDGDTESGTSLRWLLADDAQGGGAFVAGEGAAFLCGEDSEGQYLALEVVVANNGLFGDGAVPERSAWCRVFSAQNALPRAVDIRFCDAVKLCDWSAGAGAVLVRIANAAGMNITPLREGRCTVLDGIPADYADVICSPVFDVRGFSKVHVDTACAVSAAGRLGERFYVRVYSYAEDGGLLGNSYGFVNGADSAAGSWKPLVKDLELKPGAVSAKVTFRVKAPQGGVLWYLCEPAVNVF